MRTSPPAAVMAVLVQARSFSSGLSRGEQGPADRDTPARPHRDVMGANYRSGRDPAPCANTGIPNGAARTAIPIELECYRAGSLRTRRLGRR